MWILCKLRFFKCEFCEKWDFENCEFRQNWDFLNVNFVKIGIFQMWFLDKMWIFATVRWPKNKLNAIIRKLKMTIMTLIYNIESDLFVPIKKSGFMSHDVYYWSESFCHVMPSKVSINSKSDADPGPLFIAQ